MYGAISDCTKKCYRDINFIFLQSRLVDSAAMTRPDETQGQSRSGLEN